MKKKLKQVVNKVKDDQEAAARKKTLEELFYDFNRSRIKIYKLNFVRGIFFGLGSVLGGTVVIAILVWILSILGNYVPGIGNVFDNLSQLLQATE